MKRISFDRTLNGIVRVTAKYPLALAFVNLDGGVSVTKDAQSTYRLLARKPDTFRSIIGMYNAKATEDMIVEDLVHMGYLPL